MADKAIRIGRVRSLHLFPVPLQLFISYPVGNNPKQRALGQWPRIAEIARGRFVFFAGFNPFRVVTN